MSTAKREVPRKKTYRLPQSKIDEAMRVLGTRTETETIERALDLVLFRSRLVEGVRAIKGAGLVNVLDD
ncbi:MAG TPA: hypothetical protein VF746_22160 [Longimicrobium sp.]|jgi:hypothetical protein